MTLNHQLIRRVLFILAVSVVMALMTACGDQADVSEGEEPAEEAEEAPEESVESAPEEEPEPEPTEETPEEEMEVNPTVFFGETPQEALQANLLPSVGDEEIVAATLYLMLSVPYDDGDAVIFHFEDARSGVSIGCTGYSFLVEEDEGWQPIEGTFFCGPPTGPEGDPVSRFVLETPDGVAVFGEIYDASVDDILIVIDDLEMSPAQGGGAYLARTPDVAAEDIIIRVFDANEEVLFEGPPLSSGQE